MYYLVQIIPHTDSQGGRASFSEKGEKEIVRRLFAWQQAISSHLKRWVHMRVHVNNFYDNTDKVIKRKGILVQLNDQEAYKELVGGHLEEAGKWTPPSDFREKLEAWKNDLRERLDDYRKRGCTLEEAEKINRKIDSMQFPPYDFMIDDIDYGIDYFVAKYYTSHLTPLCQEEARNMLACDQWRHRYLSATSKSESGDDFSTTSLSEWVIKHGQELIDSADYFDERYESWRKEVIDYMREHHPEDVEGTIDQLDSMMSNDWLVIPDTLLIDDNDFGLAYFIFSQLDDMLPEIYSNIRPRDVLKCSVVDFEDRIEKLNLLPARYNVGRMRSWAISFEANEVADELGLRPNDEPLIRRFFDVSDVDGGPYRAETAEPYSNFEYMRGLDSKTLIAINPNPVWTHQVIHTMVNEFAPEDSYKIEWRLAANTHGGYDVVLVIKFHSDILARMMYLLYKMSKRLPLNKFDCTYIISMDESTHPKKELPRNMWMRLAFLNLESPPRYLSTNTVRAVSEKLGIRGSWENVVRKLATMPERVEDIARMIDPRAPRPTNKDGLKQKKPPQQVQRQQVQRQEPIVQSSVYSVLDTEPEAEHPRFDALRPPSATSRRSSDGREWQREQQERRRGGFGRERGGFGRERGGYQQRRWRDNSDDGWNTVRRR